MDWILHILIASFAVWRLSSLLSREVGPFRIIERTRMFVLMRTDPKKIAEGTLYDGMTCIMCNSMWFSFAISIFISDDIFYYFLNSLAISGISIIIEEIFQYLRSEQDGES